MPKNSIDTTTGASTIRRTAYITKFDRIAACGGIGQPPSIVKPSTITYTYHEWSDGHGVLIRQIWYPGDHLPFTTAFTTPKP